MNRYIIMMWIVCLLSFACSHKQQLEPEMVISNQALALQDSACGDENKVVKSVTDQLGVVRYNQFEQRYTIVVTIPNTYDSQDVGVVCNLPPNQQIDGLSVVFDGIYRSYDKQPAVKIGGQSFYYLRLNKLVIKKSN